MSPIHEKISHVSLTGCCNTSLMLKLGFIALLGLCASVSTSLAGNDRDDFINAAREGKILCMTPDPKLGCLSHSLYKIDGSLVRDRNEVVVAVSPPVVALFSSSQKLPDENLCWLLADEKIDEGPTFFRNGEKLPEIEHTMFENNFKNQLEQNQGKATRVCAIISHAQEGRTVSYIYDGKPATDPPYYFSFYTPENLPPLAFGAKSVLFTQ